MSTIGADLDELQAVKTLIDKGEFESALKCITNLPGDKILEGNILKSRILRYQLKQQAATTLIQDTLAKIQSPVIKLDALIEQAFLLVTTRKMELGWANIQQAEELMQSLSILSEKSENDLDLRHLESKLHYVKARFFMIKFKGDTYDRDKFDQAYAYLQKSLEICEITGNNYQSAGIHRHLGDLNLSKIDTDQALIHYQKSLEQYQQVGNIEAQRNNYLFLAKIYDERGNLDLALEHALKSLDIHITYKFGQEQILRIIASIYWKMGDLTRAQQILEQALEQANIWWKKNASNKSFIPSTTLVTLQYLFRLALIQGNIDSGKDLFSQMQKIYNDHKVIIENKPERIRIYYRDSIKLANALLLKQHTRIRFKIQAQEILTGIVKDSNYSLRILHQPYMLHQPYVNATPALCDLLLDELKLYGDTEVLTEIKDLIKQFNHFATANHLNPVVIEALILESKLSLIEGNIAKAGKLLDEALTITKEKKLKFSQHKVIEEKKELEANLDTWNSMVEQNASMYERINQSKLQNYLKKAQAQLFLDK